MYRMVINNCTELKLFSFYYTPHLSLCLTHNHNLQQLYSHTHVSDAFMTSVSAHGGLVNVLMSV